MAAAHVESARERTTDSRGALGAAFQVVTQGFFQIRDAVLQQERRTEERLREMERIIREAASEQERLTMEETVASIVEEARRAASSVFEDILRRVEALEMRCPPSGGWEREQPCDVEERVSQLESRMERLEGSTERALQSVVPRVDELLNRLETSSSHDPTSISTSGVASSTPLPTAPRSARSAATPPLTPERRRELGEQLLEAAKEGRETDVRRLLDEGADANTCNVGTGFTPLLYAVCMSNVHMASSLIEKGADVNAMNDWRATLLHYAAFYDISGRCASLLIYAGALVDSANSNGQTPLHWTATGDNEAAARALLAAGASKSVRDREGKTALECAKSDNLRRLLLT